ncbi:protein of unknown function [Methylocella tundrae]|uniref:Uncharacterized protein n=1 Tax=Methylocella tundrae TaxID=227605 RepID=A0A4U8Z2Y3_METTU|nr:protein of unknown function [Methylocella tundrae]
MTCAVGGRPEHPISCNRPKSRATRNSGYSFGVTAATVSASVPGMEDLRPLPPAQSLRLRRTSQP